MRAAPNTVIAVCATVIVLALIGAVTTLVALHEDPQALLGTLSAVFSGAATLLAGGSWLYSGAAAKRADSAAGTLENGVLDKRISDAIKVALVTHDQEVHGHGP